MTVFLFLTIGLRVTLALICTGICWLLFQRSQRRREGPRHYAAAGAWAGLTFAMWWYIVANIETWWWQSHLMQTFGLIVWIPATAATGGYFVVLWRDR